MSKSEKLAKKIVETLFNAGFLAYFAGGWVRDYLLGNVCSDIDIATNAKPEEVVRLFPKTIQVGIAFGVVIVVIEGRNFEVSTFRKDMDYLDGRHPSSVQFSSPKEDAMRRDFTINGMFFDPLKEEILDFVGGRKDLQSKVIRSIGSPYLRFEEDRLRMIRAVRFATRFRFSIEEETKLAIKAYAHLLFPAVSIERIWQELTKMSKLSEFHAALMELYELGLLKVIFPSFSLSFEELKQITSRFDQFPVNCPTILYLQELFPNFNLEERIDLCKYLKTTQADIKLTQFYHQSLSILQGAQLENHEWSLFYAKPYAELLLEIVSTKQSNSALFLHQHEMRQKKLFSFIQRIINNNPVINASYLLSQGISQGKRMGHLLKLAEKISINQNIEDPTVLFSKVIQAENEGLEPLP